MANTRMTATNTLNKGLVMDFNPVITKDDCLTNALNATLLTFNGNEMQLQNDMGNGRVETAFLPEGYIPVGTCEYGDIIYIVSYNPLENKSQIGCFPSPERNITSDEITEMDQSLSAEDFQKLKEVEQEDGTKKKKPTGILNATSVKKILYGNSNLNPGDKYIIYEESSADNSTLFQNKNTLSDYGNEQHSHNTWPKLVKIHVVSIEDSGKIVTLDSSVKWYDNDYYIAALNKSAATGKPDIDSYRSLVSSAYSIFQSKVSGKLALLVELESITGFGCSYDVFTKVDEGKTTYKIYFYTSWKTNHNDVNPIGFIFTKSGWTEEANGGHILIPEKQADGSYQYVVQGTQYDEPVQSGVTASGANFDSVYRYNLGYTLGTGKDYEDYKNHNYESQIAQDIVWSTSNVESSNEKKLEDLRPITKVTRLRSTADGTPLFEKKAPFQVYKYVYNLNYVNTDNNGKLVYSTIDLKGQPHELYPTEVKDEIINNYFNLDIPTYINEIELPTQTKVNSEDGVSEDLPNDLSNMIWNYEIAPVMPYGVLDWLSMTGSIDFSKIGQGLIDLITWRYYTTENVLTLTWGLDAYPEPNKGIAEVCFEFYDNQGFAACYRITGKTSYSGTFTEQIVLNQQNSSYRLSALPAIGEEPSVHAGLVDSEGDVVLVNGKPVRYTTAHEGKQRYTNDAGTIYSNFLYLVKIVVKYTTKNILDEYDTDQTDSFKYYYRWVWTNGLFNESYYSVQDFNNLQPQLNLDFSATFSTKKENGANAMSPVRVQYRSTGQLENNTDFYRTIGAQVYAINQDRADDRNGNVSMVLNPGLAEGFNTFNLTNGSGSENFLDSIPIRISLGKSSITKNIDSPNFIHTGDTFSHPLDDSIQPIIAPDLDSPDSVGWDNSGYVDKNYGDNSKTVGNVLKKLIGIKDDNTSSNPNLELYDNNTNYANYLDSFSLNFASIDNCNYIKNNTITYYDEKGDEITISGYQQKSLSLKGAMSSGVKFALTGIMFSKMFAAELAKNSSSKKLQSIVHYVKGENQSLEANGLHLAKVGGLKKHTYFTQAVTWFMGESNGDKTRAGLTYSTDISTGAWVSTNSSSTTGTDRTTDHNGWGPNLDNSEVQMYFSKYMSQPIAALVWGRSDSTNGKIDYTFSNSSFNNIRQAFGKSGVSLFNNRTDGKVHYSRTNCPSQAITKWTTETDATFFYCPVIYDEAQALFVPLADWFIGNPYNQCSPVNFRTYPQVSTLEETKYPVTLADMFASLFAQLYILDPSYNKEYYFPKNLVYLQPYTEYWNKDIVVEADVESIPQASVNNFIAFHGTPLSKYLDSVLGSFEFYEDGKSTSDIDRTNVTLSLYGIKRAFKFQFAVPYDLGDLIYDVSKGTNGTNIIELTEAGPDGQPITEYFSGNVAANTLYTWTGSEVVPFGQNDQLVYASEFDEISNRLVMKKSTTPINTVSFSTLAKIMSYQNGRISWSGLDSFSTWKTKYNWGYEGTGDNPYLKNLPKISFFNYAKI